MSDDYRLHRTEDGLCVECAAPEDALARLQDLSPTIEGFTERDRWMAALFYVEHLKHELHRIQRRNTVLEDRIKLLVEIGKGAIDEGDTKKEAKTDGYG